MLAKSVFGVDPARLTFRAAGVNHLTWFTELRIDGHDVYPELLEKLRTSGMAEKEPISLDLFEKYGLYPAPGDRHVGEFFPFYLKKEVLAAKNYKWKNNDFIVIDQWREDARLLLDGIRLHGQGFEKILEGSGETAAHFIRSLSTGDVSSEMVNVINRGYIENVSDGIIVEVPAFTDSFGIHPQKIGRLPEAIADKCDALGREYLRMVDAAVLEDRHLALQAMLADPLVSNCDDPEALLNDLIRTSGIWRASK
jgi:alpha-galactosidase